MELNREKFNQYMNHNHRIMLLMMQCSGNFFTSEDLKYV